MIQIQFVTKILSLYFLITSFSVPIGAQSKSSLNQNIWNYKLMKAKKVQKTGIILTAIGGVATIGGSVMANNGLFRQYPSTPGHITKDTHSSIGGVVGLGLMIVGIPITCIGVPTLSFGTIQKYRAKKKIQISLINIKSPYNCTSINGIGLKYNFTP